MVKVAFSTTEDGIKMTAKGHANYGEYGADIVCASVSILAFTLAEAAKQLHSSGYLSHPPYIEVSDGRIKVECSLSPEHSERVQIVYDTIKSGYQLLAYNYPENVTLDESGNTHSK